MSGAIEADSSARETGRRQVDYALVARLLAWTLAGLILVQLAANAWLSDDYFVGIRQVLNLLAGNEFSFNAGERVQTMTSPLWGMVMIGVVQAGGLFYGPIIFSLFLAMIAVALIARRALEAERAAGALLALSFLLLSRSFTDFATGGLEGPLAYALVAICVFSGARLEWSGAQTAANFRRNYLVFSLGAALLFLTRYDYAVLAGPAVVWVAVLAFHRLGLRAVIWSAPAVALVVGWMAFSTIYFGSPFSNTAFSKLATGLEGASKHEHSGAYFAASFRFDGFGFWLMGAAAVFAALTPRWRTSVWAAGVLAYMAYIYSFGGDFMAGRFFAAPIVVSACVLAIAFPQLQKIRSWRAQVSERWPAAVGLGVSGLLVACVAGSLVGALAGGTPPMKSLDLRTHAVPGAVVRDLSAGSQILDEKHFYMARRQGLFAEGGGAYRRELEALRADKWRGPGAKVAGFAGVMYVECGLAGEIGLAAGPGVYVFDSCGLADPFMSKLPMYVPHSGGEEADYRPGHFTRVMPPGYAASFSDLPDPVAGTESLGASVVARTNRLEDPDLAHLYDEVRLVVSGPLFGAERWRAIRDLHFGDTLERARGADFYMREGAPGLASAR